MGQGVHRKAMATHKTVTFVTSNTVLYFTAFTKTTTLFRFLNMKYLIQDWGLFKDSASCELFRQMWILCNSAAKGFFYRLSFPPHQNFNSTSNSKTISFYLKFKTWRRRKHMFHLASTSQGFTHSSEGVQSENLIQINRDWWMNRQSKMRLLFTQTARLKVFSK